MAHPTFRVFLSHRYKSPEVNKRFFELLTAYGAVQFEVDIGTKPTNFTRLERFVREADAFVGIYPFPGPDDGRPKAATAMRESRYFRLELDLAIRSGRPAIVFLDARYGTAMEIPQSIRQHRYDHHEIQGPGARRKESRLRSLTHDFCADVATMMRVTSNRPQPSSDRVGIVLPRRAEYSKLLIARIDKQLGEISLTPVLSPVRRACRHSCMVTLSHRCASCDCPHGSHRRVRLWRAPCWLVSRSVIRRTSFGGETARHSSANSVSA